MRPKAQIRVPVAYRFPPELKDAITAAATQAGRSENAEVIHRLEQSLTIPPAGDLAGPPKPDPK